MSKKPAVRVFYYRQKGEPGYHLHRQRRPNSFSLFPFPRAHRTPPHVFVTGTFPITGEVRSGASIVLS